MRRFEHALRLDERPVGEIKINVKSRDDIPALLLGLQHLYVSCREELEALLRCHVTADRDPEHGRPGMTLWRVLVMAGKPPGAVLDGRVDSFVVKTDVHDPMDVNLLWDAMRVLLTEVSVCCGSHGVSGWRQGQYWRNQVRQGYQRVSRARLWHRRPKAVAAWLTLCGDL